MSLLVRRQTPIWLRAGIVFIHIPKAAGTSINEALFDRFMGHARAEDLIRSGSVELSTLPRFAIARNPWDRLVSAYRFARRGKGAGGAHQAWVWRPEQYQVPQCASFERFVNEWLAPRDIRKLDGIFQPQWYFVCGPNGELLVDHMGRVEDLEPTVDFIERAIGRRPAIPESNRSGERIDFRDFYTPALVDLVGQIYREDVERFGYSFEIG